MWQPTETCESCGSAEIALVESCDSSTGYRGEEWICCECGSNCEEWVATTPVVAQTLAAEMALVEAEDRRRAIIRGGAA